LPGLEKWRPWLWAAEAVAPERRHDECAVVDLDRDHVDLGWKNGRLVWPRRAEARDGGY